MSDQKRVTPKDIFHVIRSFGFVRPLRRNSLTVAHNGWVLAFVAVARLTTNNY